jgi:hypothetical protein
VLLINLKINKNIIEVGEDMSRRGTAMNQRCSESNGLPKDEDTKLKKKRKLLVRNAEGISLVVTVFRIP